ALLPLLTLGIPTSATAAIMLAAFNQYGLQPGPLLFRNSEALVWGLVASLYLGNLALLILNLPLIRIWVKMLDIPTPLLYSGILVFATLGAYSLAASVVDLTVMAIVGVLAYGMRRMDFPIAPLIVGAILGPRIEQEFRRALSVSLGDPTTFLTRPISASIIAAAVLILCAPRLISWWRGRQAVRPPINT
ncbi:MAG TPA: tripartite tricarboxylate transporter permease, partial [Burkholderiales bacterium]